MLSSHVVRVPIRPENKARGKRRVIPPSRELAREETDREPEKETDAGNPANYPARSAPSRPSMAPRSPDPPLAHTLGTPGTASAFKALLDARATTRVERPVSPASDNARDDARGTRAGGPRGASVDAEGAYGGAHAHECGMCPLGILQHFWSGCSACTYSIRLHTHAF